MDETENSDDTDRTDSNDTDSTDSDDTETTDSDDTETQILKVWTDADDDERNDDIIIDGVMP